MGRRPHRLHPEREHQGKGRREKHRRKGAQDRSHRGHRRNIRMGKPVGRLGQKGKHHREREYGQKLAPEKCRRLYRRKLQQFQGIAFPLPRKRIAGQGCPHGRHEAPQQKHHVTFHAFHNLPAVAGDRNPLARRENHRRDDEGNPEFRVPEYQAKFVSKNMEHGLEFRSQDVCTGASRCKKTS